MKKILLSMFFTVSLATAGLVDAIALKVNNDIVTLVDIDNKMQSLNIDKQKAVNLIVDEMLYDQELKRHYIVVSANEIEQRIANIANSNNMNIDQFKQAVKAQTNYDIFENDIKTKLLKEKLSKKVVAGNIRYATDEDTKIYYENNQNLFSVAAKIDVVKYSSTNQNLLVQVTKNPMFVNESIVRTNETIDMSNINSNIRYLLNGIENGKFTKISQTNNGFMMYFVKEKKDITVLEFEKVKDKIFQIIMQNRENKYLKDYFNNLRIKSDIEVLR